MTAAANCTGIRDLALWVGLYRIALGIMWLQMALQKAPWVIGPEGKPYGWLYGYIFKEINNPTFGFYTEFLKNVILPNSSDRWSGRHRHANQYHARELQHSRGMVLALADADW
jgi:hypothetical protein